MPAALVANVCILLVFVVGAILLATDAELYYRTGQEDESLEWATFWTFLLSAMLYARAATISAQ